MIGTIYELGGTIYHSSEKPRTFRDATRSRRDPIIGRLCTVERVYGVTIGLQL